MFAGIDWGGHHHQVAVVTEEGQVVVNRRVSYDLPGLDELRAVLTVYGNGDGLVPVAIERAEGLLVETLQAWGHPVYPVSPRIAARARERYLAVQKKDDRFDGFVLADTLRYEIDRWRPLRPMSDALAELRALWGDRRRILETQKGIEAQLRSALDAYYPAAGRLFSAVDRQVTLAFLRDYPTPQAASRIREARMRRFLERHGYTGRVPAEVLVGRVWAGLMEVGEGSTAGRSYGALALADQLELLNKQLKGFDERIATVYARHADSDLFTSFP
jgi:transposase